MPRRPSYTPTHRAERAALSPLTRVRGVLALPGAAVAATGLAVASGVVLTGSAASDQVVAAAPAPRTVVHAGPATSPALADALADRARPVSRSVRRAPVDRVKARALDQESGGQRTETEDLTTGDPRTIARAMLPRFGFGADQFSCLDSIYVNESGWDVHADNPTSSAFGIPQALPGSKMASAGADWADNPATQIEWGLGYIKARYGTPCNAWGFKQAHGWY